MRVEEKLVLFLFALLFGVASLFSACAKKADKPPIAIITVLDSLTGGPLDSVRVRLHLDTLKSTVTGNPALPPDPDTKYTDAYGQVSWTLKNPASYFAEITSDFSPDVAKKFVVFKKNEVNEVTVYY